MKAYALLNELQKTVVSKVLEEESAQRQHLVVSLSGSHAYGFPSLDSDIDLKCIHIEPTRSLVGIYAPKLHASRVEIIQGVEIDYSSNELGSVLLGILQGNGNYIERVLSGYTLSHSHELEELKPLVQQSLSRRMYRHYSGFAFSQKSAFEQSEQKAIKKILYAFRTTLTGTHALYTGEIVTHLETLIELYQLPFVKDLMEAKKAGERSTLTNDEIQLWSTPLEQVFAKLEEAYKHSRLPIEPSQSSITSLNAWLIESRRTH